MQLVKCGLDAGVKDGAVLALQVETPGEVLRRESSVPVRYETGYVVAGMRIVNGIERLRIHHDASTAALGVGLGDGLDILHGERADPRANGYPPRRLLVLPSMVPSRFLRTFRQPHRPAIRYGHSSSSVTSR